VDSPSEASERSRQPMNALKAAVLIVLIFFVEMAKHILIYEPNKHSR
jgi:hypothetical protein